MKRTRSVALATLLLAASAGAASAQTALTLGTGFGVTIPMGDAADFFNVGWHAQGNIGFSNPEWPVGLRIDGMYHTLGGEDIGGFESEDLTVIAGVANVQLFLSRNTTGGGLFVVGGGGMYNLDFGEGTDSETKFGFMGGAGYKFAMTNLMLSLEAKYHHILTDNDPIQLIPITLAVELPMGGN